MLVHAAVAGPFTQLVVFGDSLSDVGNIDQVTPSFFKFPGPFYYDGRFSNGPVYVEALATGLGLPPIVHSQSGGSNFAYGGAKTFGTGGLEGIYIRDIDEQVTEFLATPAADPNALFVVYAGSNDLVGGETDMSIPVNSLAEDIGRLVADGARKFLVPNLPLLGHTPRYNGLNGMPNMLDTFNMRSQQFNTALSTMLDALEAGNPDLTIFRFDVAALFSQALADPASFGLTNVIIPAAQGLEPGASSCDACEFAPNAHEYMFWDDLHPTATVHAILAERALELFFPPGDFNRDTVVDAADYVVWRKENGSIEDYNTWRAHFGETAGGGSSIGGLASVPEPETLCLAVLGIAAICAGKRRAMIRYETASN